MPVDEDGNRADIVMDDTSVISRMNISKLHEVYLSASARDIAKHLRRALNIKEEDRPHIKHRQFPLTDEYIRAQWDHLMGYYKVVSTRQYDFFTSLSIEDCEEHFTDVLRDGVYIYSPIENDIDAMDRVDAIDKHYRPTFGPVTYIGNSGITRTTKEPVRIAPMYIMLLDKICDNWSAVSTAKLHHFGVLAPIAKSEKRSYPYRSNPIKNVGETEGRIYAGYCGREAIAELMDRNNNPVTQRNMVHNILNADKPTNIENVVDRDYIELGGSKALQLVKHVLYCSGIKVVYEPEDIQ